MIAGRARTRGLLAIGLWVIGIGLARTASVASSPDIARKVETRGVPVSVAVTPGCRLGGDDPDAKARTDNFMTELRAAVAKAITDVEFPVDYSGWAAELDVESASLHRVRITKSIPRLDLQLMQRMSRANMPALPNFRLRCTLAVRVDPWRAVEAQ